MCIVWRVEFGKLAVETKALNLGQGFPDYMPPSVVTEALKQVACSSNPLVHQYTRSYVSHMIYFIIYCLFYSLIKQEAQLSQRDRAVLRVIEYFAKSLEVIRMTLLRRA